MQKAAKDHLGVDGEEESTMYEDSVAPAKWVALITASVIVIITITSTIIIIIIIIITTTIIIAVVIILY